MIDSPDAITATTVRALATARGMTHSDVAEASGMPRSRFERRLAKGGWTLEEADRLAELFGVSLDELKTGLGGQLLPEASAATHRG